MECRHVASDADLFTLTPAGAEAWRAREKIQAPKGNEWPTAFRCLCPHGTLRWRDEQGYYGCDRCSIEFSPDPLQKNLWWKKDGEVRRILSHADAWTRAGMDSKPTKLGHSSAER